VEEAGQRDLYFRLKRVPIVYDPVLGRGGGDPLRDVIEYYLDALRAQDMGKPIAAVDRDALKRLEAYRWPWQRPTSCQSI